MQQAVSRRRGRVISCLGQAGLILCVVSCTNDASNTERDAQAPDPGPKDASQQMNHDGGAPIDVRSPDTEPPPRFGLQQRPANTTCKPPADLNAPALRLSQTGCVDPNDPRKPAPGLIPYDVASPLWSDGAAKQRFIALPEGDKIRVKDCRERPEDCLPASEGGTPESDGKLDVPVGTVLVKNFAFGNSPLETRLFIRFADQWVGYSYQWRDDGSDADLVEDVFGGKSQTIRNDSGREQMWTFPSREMCTECHTRGAGGSLGLEMRQFNIDYTYPSGVRSNQLETLEHIGVFEKPLMRPFMQTYPDPANAQASIDQRARSYLHANCANCHRPQGNFDAIDLRFDSELSTTDLCNTQPTRGSLGIDDAVRLSPGKPELSLLSLRMRATNEDRMPRVATSMVDEDGATLVEQWIRSIERCP